MASAFAGREGGFTVGTPTLGLTPPLPYSHPHGAPRTAASYKRAVYAALWCKSNFSFLEGASRPDEFVEAAQRLGLAAVAVTDRDGVAGIVRAHVKAKELGFPLIVGSEVTIDGGGTVVLLARDRAGYANLCGLVSAGRLRSPKGESRVTWDEVCAHAGGLAALVHEGGAPFGSLRDAFGEHAYALVARHRAAEEVEAERRLRAEAEAAGLPVVAGTRVLYHRPDRRRLQDVLTCIRHGTTLSAAGRLLEGNGEHYLLPPAAFAKLFADERGALERTNEVAAACTFSMGELRYRYPLAKLAEGESEMDLLRRLTFEGARGRYGGASPAAVREQLEKELSIISALDYGGYFLTMHDIAAYCRSRGILAQGRGSAANSAVCYCLGITAVDPVRMGLLFERFLSMERAEPPDIDLDVEHERREEVIQHMYALHGRTHAAMVANVIRYRSKSALRDVGKALGFAETSLMRASDMLSGWDALDETTLAEAGFDLHARQTQLLGELVAEIEDFPRHLSIHPGGFLLGHEPVSTLVPIENATMEDRTVIQWDKDDVEALGLFKVDILALGALTHLHRTFDLVAEHEGKQLSMATIPPDDSATYDEICRGDTVGVFQIESRAQMAMLPRLRPRSYYDLVIQVSIVRPGPITGGMVHPYLRRRAGEEEVEYPHPSLEPVLAKTLGVPLFQEQVMRLAVVAADYTPGEADQLRRDMAAWRKSGRIEHHRERLVSRMKKKGIAEEFAVRVFEQIKGFGEYGFPESHAASFALISYAGAYLRTHHRVAFTCGLLNAQPMGFYSAATIVEDAKRHGVAFLPVDVTRSVWDCAIEDGAIRMGMRYVKRARREAIERLLAARSAAPFASLADFHARAQPDAATADALSESGAFDALTEGRRDALWRTAGLALGKEDSLYEHDDGPEHLFETLRRFEEIGWDHQSSSHSVRGHPLAPLRSLLAKQGLPDARAVNAMPGGRRVRFAGLVICRQRPGTASGVTFMTLEDESGFVNLVVWLDVFERYRVLARTTPFLGVTGTVQREGAVVHVVATDFWRPELRAPAEPRSRDFH